MAIACFLLFTVPPLPPFPDLSVPLFSRCIALLTLLPAAFPYLAMFVLSFPLAARGVDTASRQRNLSSSLKVDPLSYLAEQSVRIAFFFLDRFQSHHVFVKTEDLGPAAQCAVDGDLVMLHLLRRADERDVPNRCVGHILDRIGSFRGETVDDLTSLSLAITDAALQQTLDPAHMAPGFFKVGLKREDQVGIGGFFDQVGKSFGYLLLH